MPNNKSLYKTNLYLPVGYKFYFQLLLGFESKLEGQSWILCHSHNGVHS